jgi:hypothetical protein
MQSGEIQYAHMQHDGTPPRADEYSPPPNAGSAQRKRTYSSISNEFGAGFQHPRASMGWNQEPPRQLPHPSGAQYSQAPQDSLSYRPQYSPNGMAPQPLWTNGPDSVRRPSVSYENFTQANHNHVESRLEWDDAIIDRYYTLIHPTFQILPMSKSKLSARLNNCQPTLREAFFEALYSAVHAVPGSNFPPAHENQSNRRAIDLITALQFEGVAARTTSANLLYLQTMLLMVIEADCSPSRAQLGPSKSVWLGSAVGLAYSMKLHIFKPIDKSGDADADSDELLSRRLWWSLVILDRWHASSTSSPIMIPETSVVLLPDDQLLLGDSTYHMARKSILVHIHCIC